MTNDVQVSRAFYRHAAAARHRDCEYAVIKHRRLAHAQNLQRVIRERRVKLGNFGFWDQLGVKA